jgi:hypothetical protein
MPLLDNSLMFLSLFEIFECLLSSQLLLWRHVNELVLVCFHVSFVCLREAYKTRMLEQTVEVFCMQLFVMLFEYLIQKKTDHLISEFSIDGLEFGLGPDSDAFLLFC